MSVATILTYHRIVADGGRERFYDIEASQFLQQLRRVAEATPAAASGVPDGRVWLTFDDGTADHRRAADLLSSQGLLGTFFIITGRLGAAGYLSERDVRSIADAGHSIASHSVTHRRLTSLSAADLDDELAASRRHLEALVQRRVDWFAAPGGVCSPAVVDHALQAGYQVVRTMDWGYAKLPLRGQVPCIPVFARYDSAMFDRLLDGRAPLWVYSVKNLVKRSLGSGLYATLRDLSDRFVRR